MNRARDPAAMTPAAVKAELAAILAAGWWRVFTNQTELADRGSHEPLCASAVDGAQISHEEQP